MSNVILHPYLQSLLEKSELELLTDLHSSLVRVMSDYAKNGKASLARGDAEFANYWAERCNETLKEAETIKAKIASIESDSK